MMLLSLNKQQPLTWPVIMQILGVRHIPLQWLLHDPRCFGKHKAGAEYLTFVKHTINYAMVQHFIASPLPSS